MSLKIVAANNKSKQILRTFRHKHNNLNGIQCDSKEGLSTENVLASVKPYQVSDHEVGEVLLSQRKKTKSRNEKLLQQQIIGHKSKSVEDIEKWLKYSTESISETGINMKNNALVNVERYLNEPLLEIFSEKIYSNLNNDSINKRSNVDYDTIITDLHDKFLSNNENQAEFILPELQLDNLDHLTNIVDDAILINEIESTNYAPLQCNVTNVNTKDLVIRLQETINKINASDGIVGHIQLENELEDSNKYQDENYVNNLESNENESFYSTFSPKGIQNSHDDNTSHNESNIINSKNYANFESEDTSKSQIESERLASRKQSCVERKSKRSCKKYSNVNALNISLENVKPKFQPSIITRRRKQMESIYCYNRDNLKIVSLDEQPNISDFILKNKKNDKSLNRILTCNKQTKEKSITCEREELSKPKYYNPQELVISRALEEVGITDNKLQYTRVGDYAKFWQCHQDGCIREFTKLCGLKAHLLTHFNIKPFKCDYDNCSWAFYSEFKLKRHKETHLKKKDYMCSMPGCKRRFTTVYNLASHEKLHMRPNRIICQVPECAAKFQTKRALEIHMKNHDESLAPYVCNYEGCGKRYYGSNALISHQRCHNYSSVDITCFWPDCGKSFDQPCRLKAHMRSHTGHKPYICSFKGCKWAFPTSSKLKRHQKKHTNDRKFICDIDDCKKAFMRSEHLREHKLTHAAEKIFRCHVCDSSFTAKSSLYVHVKKHSNKDYVSRANRQPKKKKTVEKKTLNKKKEVFCPKVQPIRIASCRLNKWSIINSSESEQQTNNQNKFKEENENAAVKEPIDLSNSAEGRTLRDLYFCPIDSCTRWYPTKLKLRMHLQKEHIIPLSEIQNNNVVRVVSSSPLNKDDLNLDNTPKSSINKANESIILPSYDITFLNNQLIESTNNESTILETEFLSTMQNINYEDLESKTMEQYVSENEGSARTAFTCEQVFNLKPNRGIIDSNVGASDIVLGSADLDGLLLSEELSSIYCEEDITDPGHQILLLDTGPVDSDISMRNLD